MDASSLKPEAFLRIFLLLGTIHGCHMQLLQAGAGDKLKSISLFAGIAGLDLGMKEHDWLVYLVI